MENASPETSPANDVPDPAGEFPVAPPEYLLYLVYLACRLRDQKLEAALAGVGLNVARWRTLACIRRIGACSMRELALYSTIDRTTLTRTVDQLVAQGLVERATPPQDRRKVLLLLTEAGADLHARALPVVRSCNAGVLEGAADAQIRTAARVLQGVIRRTVDNPDDAQRLIDFERL